MRAKVNESPSIKSKMDDVAEAVTAVKRDLIREFPDNPKKVAPKKNKATKTFEPDVDGGCRGCGVMEIPGDRADLVQIAIAAMSAEPQPC
jgi:hypothetical protein